MADKKLTELTELTNPSGDDILYIVDTPAGTPATRKVTVANLLAPIGDLSTLSTTPKTSVAGAIGTTALGTTATTISGAIAEVNTNTDAVTAEVVAGRGSYADLDTRLDSLVIGQISYRSGATIPNISVTPYFIGEEYLDWVAHVWYKSFNLTDT